MSDWTTALTDYALAAVSVVLAVRIGRSIRSRNRLSGWFWCAAFVAAGIAAVAGGTFHAASARFEPGTLRVLWNVAIFSMGACGAFVSAAIHSAHIRRRDGTMKWLAWGIAVTLVGAVVQQSGWRHGAPWNHNDVYHLVQIGGLVCFFRSARMMRDRPGVPDSSPSRNAV